MQREYPIEIIGYQIYAQENVQRAVKADLSNQGLNQNITPRKDIVTRLSAERSRVSLSRIGDDDEIICDIRIAEWAGKPKQDSKTREWGWSFSSKGNEEFVPLSWPEIQGLIKKVNAILNESGFFACICDYSVIDPVLSLPEQDRTTTRRIYGNTINLQYKIPYGAREQFAESIIKLDRALNQATIRSVEQYL